MRPMSRPLTMSLHLNLQHHSLIVQPSLIHPKRKIAIMNNPKQINGSIWTNNEDVHEPKEQRLPNDLETQTRSELPTTYPFIPINTIVTEDVYIPTDPLLEILTIPTFSQLQPQPQTIDSTSNETTLDNPNQEHVATESYGFKPHPIPATIEPSSESPSQATSIDLTPSPQELTIFHLSRQTNLSSPGTWDNIGRYLLKRWGFVYTEYGCYRGWTVVRPLIISSYQLKLLN